MWPFSGHQTLKSSRYSHKIKLCFTQFRKKIYWNKTLAASDLFHMFTQSIKFYTFKCHILMSNSSNNQKMNGCFFQQVLREDLIWLLTQRYSQGKSILKINLQCSPKYQYRHLCSWFNKSTLYKRFLNWNNFFEKNKVVTGKTSFFVIVHFVLPLASDRAVL